MSATLFKKRFKLILYSSILETLKIQHFQDGNRDQSLRSDIGSKLEMEKFFRSVFTCLNMFECRKWHFYNAIWR